MKNDSIKKEYYELTDSQKKYSRVKDIIDRTAGVIGTIVAAPVFLGICIAIKVEEGMKAPVFFKQKRVGKDQKLFNLYKFRTMKLSTPHDMPTHLLLNPESYLTKCGRVLRKYSLDELPQFLNIIKGDMAISGPRPALWNQDDLIAEREAYGVHQIKPGLTGWAQIHGRDELEIEDKARLDAYYLHNLGLWIDIKCFFGTILSVVKSDGVVEGGTGEMKKQAESKVGVYNPRKVIIVANVAKEHILKFHVPTIKMLKKNGWYVDVACSGSENIPYCDNQYHMAFKRNPFSLGTLKGVMQLRAIYKKGEYDVVSSHTPTGGLVARIAALKLKNKPYIIYTAHGFHFYKGAPLLNWLIYFPIEWILSYATDELVVINKEDYGNALKYHMGMKKLSLVHGMGVDTERFRDRFTEDEKHKLRDELCIPQDAFLYTYVAEIIKNKNQQVLIKALSSLRKKTGKGYLLLVGPIHDDGLCQKLVAELGLQKYVIFTGWRDDVEKIYQVSNVCVASSIREGLGLNIIEAQLSGIPVIASDNRGHREVLDEHCGILVENEPASFARAMLEMMNHIELREKYVKNGYLSAEKFSLNNSLSSIWKILSECDKK